MTTILVYTPTTGANTFQAVFSVSQGTVITTLDSTLLFDELTEVIRPSRQPNYDAMWQKSMQRHEALLRAARVRRAPERVLVALDAVRPSQPRQPPQPTDAGRRGQRRSPGPHPRRSSARRLRRRRRRACGRA